MQLTNARQPKGSVFREAEQQRKRDEVIQRHQDRDRYNAERKDKRVESSNRGRNELSK